MVLDAGADMLQLRFMPIDQHQSGPAARGPLPSFRAYQPILRSLLRKGTSSPFYAPFDGTSPIYSFLLFTPSGAKIPFELSHIRVKYVVLFAGHLYGNHWNYPYTPGAVCY